MAKGSLERRGCTPPRTPWFSSSVPRWFLSKFGCLAWMERLRARAADLIASEEVALMAGDYNIIPNAEDAAKPDSWRDDAESVDVAEIVEQMNANAAIARKTVEIFCKGLPKKRNPSPIDQALADAVITAPDKHDKALVAKLDAVAGRLLSRG